MDYRYTIFLILIVGFQFANGNTNENLKEQLTYNGEPESEKRVIASILDGMDLLLNRQFRSFNNYKDCMEDAKREPTATGIKKIADCFGMLTGKQVMDRLDTQQNYYGNYQQQQQQQYNPQQGMQMQQNLSPYQQQQQYMQQYNQQQQMTPEQQQQQYSQQYNQQQQMTPEQQQYYLQQQMSPQQQLTTQQQQQLSPEQQQQQYVQQYNQKQQMTSEQQQYYLQQQLNPQQQLALQQQQYQQQAGLGYEDQGGYSGYYNSDASNPYGQAGYRPDNLQQNLQQLLQGYGIQYPRRQQYSARFTPGFTRGNNIPYAKKGFNTRSGIEGEYKELRGQPFII